MFSERIKKLRLENNKTQQDIANYLNVDRTTIGKYETTNTIPQIDTLIKLSEYFDVTLEYLVGVSSSKKHVYKNTNDIENKLLKKYSMLDSNSKKTIDFFIDNEIQHAIEKKELIDILESLTKDIDIKEEANKSPKTLQEIKDLEAEIIDLKERIAGRYDDIERLQAAYNDVSEEDMAKNFALSDKFRKDRWRKELAKKENELDNLSKDIDIKKEAKNSPETLQEIENNNDKEEDVFIKAADGLNKDTNRDDLEDDFKLLD